MGLNTKISHNINGEALDIYFSDKVIKDPILFIGGIHGDEPEGVWLAELVLDLLRSKKATPPWILIPCVNPTGYKMNQRVNYNLVDLNRNFPDPEWSLEAKMPRYNPGPYPLSEQETKIIVELIENYKPSLIIHTHSWEPSIVVTHHTTQILPAIWLSENCGYELKNDIGYSTPGSIGEYGSKIKKIPVICIEIQEKIEKNKIWPLFNVAMEKIFFTHYKL